jgi:hypothetical protein
MMPSPFVDLTAEASCIVDGTRTEINQVTEKALFDTKSLMICRDVYL